MLQFFFVAPRTACRSCSPGIGIRMCARGAVYALVWKPMVCIILLPAGCLAVETMHVQGQTFCCSSVLVRSMPAPLRVRTKVRRSQEALGGRARPRGLHRSKVQ